MDSQSKLIYIMTERERERGIINMKILKLTIMDFFLYSRMKQIFSPSKWAEN